MSTVQIIMIPITCTAAILAAIAAITSWRAARRARRAVKRTFPWKGGEVTVTAPMTAAEYEEIKARWQALHGQPGRAHQVDVLKPEEARDA